MTGLLHIILAINDQAGIIMSYKNETRRGGVEVHVNIIMVLKCSVLANNNYH